MLIKQLYNIKDDSRLMIELYDGSLHTFLLTPARKLTAEDLTAVQTPLPKEQYMAYVKADPYEGPLERMQMMMFDLTKSKLAQLRKDADMTQDQLAEASGVNRVQISRIERCEIKLDNISLANAAALAKALGVSAEDLLS